jgi:hypothetical protein
MASTSKRTTKKTAGPAANAAAPEYEGEYTPVELPETTATALPDVHLDVAGHHLDLPNLNGPRIPVELLTGALSLSKSLEDGSITSGAANGLYFASIAEWFKREHPDFWQFVATSKDGVLWLSATVEAWQAQSGLDPKSAS